MDPTVQYISQLNTGLYFQQRGFVYEINRLLTYLHIDHLFLLSARHGCLHLMKCLYRSGRTNINSRSYGFLGPPLVTAMQFNHRHIVFFLLQLKELKIDCPDTEGNTAAMFLFNSGFSDLKYINFFISSGVNLYQLNNNGETLLFAAVRSGNINVIQYLLEKKIIIQIINYKNKDGTSSLMEAIKADRYDIVELLLSVHGIDVISTDLNGYTPFALAAFYNRPDIMKLLSLLDNTQYYLSKVNKDGNTPFLIAVKNRHIKVIDYLIQNHLFENDFNHQNNDGNSGLILASALNFPEIVKKILSIPKINYNCVNNYGYTAFTFALFYKEALYYKDRESYNDILFTHSSFTNRFEVIELLSKILTLDINHTDNANNTPLLLSLRQNDKFTFQYLIQLQKTNIRHLNDLGQDAFFFAVRYADLSIIQKISKLEGIDINRQDIYGNTPLIYAIERGQLFIIKYLTQLLNICPSISNNDGDTPLIRAVYKKSLSMVKSLSIFENINYNHCNQTGSSALHIATKLGCISICQFLVNRKNININLTNIDGHTALDIGFIRCGHTNFIASLPILRYSQLNYIDSDQHTALFYAVLFGKLDLIKRIINKRLKPQDDIDHINMNIFLCAIYSGHIEIVRYLSRFRNSGYTTTTTTTTSDGLLQSMIRCATIRGDIPTIQLLLQKYEYTHDSTDESSHDLIDESTHKSNDEHTHASINELLPALLELSLRNCQIEMFEYLSTYMMKYSQSYNINIPISLNNAIEDGLFHIVTKLYTQKNIYKNTFKEADFRTAIHYNLIDVIKYFYSQKNTNFNGILNNKKTGLITAATYGYTEIIHILTRIPNNNINRIDFEGNTAITSAAENGHIDIVQILSQLPNLYMNYKCKPRYATQFTSIGLRGGVYMLKIISALSNIDYNYQDSNGNTLFFLAVKNGNINLFLYLSTLENIDMEIPDKQGQTPIFWAIKNNRVKIVEYLLTIQGININKLDINGDNMCVTTIKDCFYSMSKMLIACPNFNIFLPNKRNDNILSLAVQNNWKNYLNLILDKLIDF